MFSLTLVIAATCIAAGYALGRLLEHHRWLAYLLAVVVGPVIGLCAFVLVTKGVVGGDMPIVSITRGMGESLWIGVMFAPLGVFLTTYKQRPDPHSNSRRPAIGTAPLAPRPPAHRRRNRNNHEAILRAFGDLLGDSKSRFHSLDLFKSPSPEAVVAAGSFALMNGRSVEDLPAPKDDIEQALRAELESSDDPERHSVLGICLMALADFQDVAWCKSNDVDPTKLVLADSQRFYLYLQRLEKRRRPAR